MTAHADRELAIFDSFVRLSGLPIDRGSIEKRNGPDIWCRHEVEGPVAFELSEVIRSCRRRIQRAA